MAASDRVLLIQKFQAWRNPLCNASKLVVWLYTHKSVVIDHTTLMRQVIKEKS